MTVRKWPVTASHERPSLRHGNGQQMNGQQMNGPRMGPPPAAHARPTPCVRRGKPMYSTAMGPNNYGQYPQRY